MYFSASKLIRGLESCMIEQQPAVYAEKIDYKKLLNVFDEDGKKKNSADPFVIALAKENFCKAVAE